MTTDLETSVYVNPTKDYDGSDPRIDLNMRYANILRDNGLESLLATAISAFVPGSSISR